MNIQINRTEPANLKPRFTSKRASRKGLVLLETIVAASMVMAMLVVATPMVIRSARIWKQTRHYQFAGDELAGQMDRLIAMPADARAEALGELTVSTQVQAVLHEATLEGTMLQDDNGKRIELSINWKRVGTPKPVTLVAWIDPLPDSTPNQLNPDDATTDNESGDGTEENE